MALTFGVDKLCRACLGAGATYPADRRRDARPAFPRKLAAGKTSHAIECPRCHGTRIEPRRPVDELPF